MSEICERCAHEPEKRVLVRSRSDSAVASPCPACTEHCPICRGQRFVERTDERGYDFLIPCSCKAQFDRIDRFNGAGIPARYAHCTLAAYEAKGGNQRAVHRTVDKHLAGFHPGVPGLLLAGPVGTGKTHLLVAALRHITLESGIRARFIEFTHLLSDIKEGFNTGKSEAEILGPLSQIPVLGIDELGKGLATEWQLSVLDELISRRYNLGLTTYFTTNLNVTDTEPSPENQPVTARSGDLRRALERITLVDRVGERIFSRLHEMCRFVVL
ncbi:MAG: ATP-binding protein, partial [Myxococcales bacterium]|nr:ATP-binding protein [Myxococcales bacterium]